MQIIESYSKSDLINFLALTSFHLYNSTINFPKDSPKGNSNSGTKDCLSRGKEDLTQDQSQPMTNSLSQNNKGIVAFALLNKQSIFVVPGKKISLVCSHTKKSCLPPDADHLYSHSLVT